MSLNLVGCLANQETGVSLITAPWARPTASATPFLANSPTAAPSWTPTVTFTPTVTPSPTPEKCMEQGRVEEKEIPSNLSQYPIKFRVYLPPCFDSEADRRYPVLYIIHGQTFNDDQWDRMGMDETASTLITEELTLPFMIVMPLERNTFEDIYVSPFPSDLTDNLIPYIDQTYPTCADRACRAIGGLSRGGAWALRLGFQRWDLFGAIGLHSTPPFIGDPNQFPYWLREIPTDQLPRVWMDTGTKDWYIGPTKEFEAMLTRLEVPHVWNNFEGTHDEAYWSAHVIDYLLWYSEGWKDLLEEYWSR